MYLTLRLFLQYLLLWVTLFPDSYTLSTKWTKKSAEIIFLTAQREYTFSFYFSPKPFGGGQPTIITMGQLAVEKKRAEACKDKKVDGFSGAIRSLEVLNLEEGDVLTFPLEYEVYEQKFGDNVAQYIFCQIGDTDNVKPFYPSTFTKSRQIYDEDLEPTGKRVHTKGTAAELFRQFGSVQEGMDALKGKKVKVTKIEKVRTLRFNTDSLMWAYIPTIDLVEDTPEA